MYLSCILALVWKELYQHLVPRTLWKPKRRHMSVILTERLEVSCSVCRKLPEQLKSDQISGNITLMCLDYCIIQTHSSYLCSNALVASILKQVPHHIQVIFLGSHVQRSESILLTWRTKHRTKRVNTRNSYTTAENPWLSDSDERQRIKQLQHRGPPETVRWYQHHVCSGSSPRQPGPPERICGAQCFLSGIKQ